MVLLVLSMFASPHQNKTRSSKLSLRKYVLIVSCVCAVAHQLSPPKTVSKTVELKQRAEAVATQRQEVKIPLKEHRRFSETVAIDHRARPQELQVCFGLSLILKAAQD